MKIGSKIGTKGWVVVGILIAFMIILVFVMGKQASEKNTAWQNGQPKSGTTIQTRSPENRLTPEEKKRMELQQKRSGEKADETDEDENKSPSATPNWLMTLKTLFSEYGLQVLALIVSAVGVILAMSGFSLSGKKKQKFLKKYFHEIDDAYGAFKMKGKRCEAELYRLQDLIEHELKEGKIDENTFQLLEKRIEKYLKEVKEQESV